MALSLLPSDTQNTPPLLPPALLPQTDSTRPYLQSRPAASVLGVQIKETKRVLGEAKDAKIGRWRVCGNAGRGGSFCRWTAEEADPFSYLPTCVILRAKKV